MPRNSLDVQNGTLKVCSDSNRDYPDYLQWEVAHGRALGIATNTKATRRWLRTALNKLEKDAVERGLKD